MTTITKSGSGESSSVSVAENRNERLRQYAAVVITIAKRLEAEERFLTDDETGVTVCPGPEVEPQENKIYIPS